MTFDMDEGTVLLQVAEAADDQQLRAALEQAARFFSRTINNNARRIDRKWASKAGGLTDEARSVGYEVLLKMLAEHRDGKRVHNFGAVLTTRTHNAMWQHVNGSAGQGGPSGMTGMSGLLRRRQAAARARADLAQQLGREATDEEVVEHVNAQARTRRKDPERQGAIITTADLSPIGVHTSDEEGRSVLDMICNLPPFTILDPIEWKEAINDILATCRRLHGHTAHRAACLVWCPLLDDLTTPIITQTSFAKALGPAIGRRDCLRLWHLVVQQVPRDVLASRLAAHH